MKFINTLEENGGVFGEGGGGARKVALGSWLNPTRGRGPAWASACAWAGGGRREGGRHKPVQLTKSFVPWGGGVRGGRGRAGVRVAAGRFGALIPRVLDR